MSKDLQCNSANATITFPEEMSFVPTREYKSLIQERNDLRLQVKQLEGNADVLRQTISKNTDEISLLREENRMLKEEIVLLKSKINSQDNAIKKLEKEMEDTRYEKLSSVFKIVIRDISDDEQIEESNNSFSDILYYIRTSRNGDCHYLLKGKRGNTDDDIKLKKYVARLKMQEIVNNNPSFVKKFEQEFEGEGLIRFIINHLPTSYPSTKKEKDIDRIVKEWWKISL